MQGNVSEWCADWYGDYPVAPIINPLGPDNGVDRVLRGGSWTEFGSEARSAIRDSNEPSFKYDLLGLRFASKVF